MDGALDTAVEVSRNLCQYLGADSHIFEYGVRKPLSAGNLITILCGMEKIPDFPRGYPIRFFTPKTHRTGLQIDRYDVDPAAYPLHHDLGLICICPLGSDRFELIIWGVDGDSLRRAARLIPLLPGVGQADFIVVGRQMAVHGASGVQAMGCFDYCWNTAPASFCR